LLGNKPSKISVGEVLRVLEGDFATVDEQNDDQNSNASNLQGFIQLMVWDKLAENVYEFVNSITIEDVANEYKKANGTEKLMYYI
jgi:DNA-binding IscR family transcriptional regulator